MEAAMTGPDAGLPLVIGVTGHRDLVPESLPELRAQVAAFFADLRRDYPHTRLMLMSPLATGADQLVAVEYLALPADARAGLVAVLPMPARLFKQDFSATELTEFERLLGAAQQVLEIPGPSGADTTLIDHPGLARDRQYQICGQLISRHSQILIALWNGRSSDAVGGTADIVGFRQTGVALGLTGAEGGDTLLDLEDRGPVFQISAPRLRDDPTAPQEGSAGTSAGRWLYPPMVRGDMLDPETYFSGLWTALDRFNRDLASLDNSAMRVAKSANQLMPDASVSTLPTGLLLLRRRYAAADALAISLQRRWRQVQRALHVLVACALISIESAQLDREIGAGRLAPWLFSAALLFMLAAWGIFRSGDRRRLQDRYQDYRALAEGLRVQLFWSLGGVTERAADRYLGRLRNALDWIRKGVRNASICTLDMHERAQHRLVHAWWVRSQFEYYSRGNDARRERLASAASSFLLAVAAIAGLVLLAAVWWETEDEAANRMTAIALCLALVPAGLAGVVSHYAEKMAFGEHAKLYRRMTRLFDYAQELLTSAVRIGDEDQATRVITELGLAALEENGSWVLLHRERPLEMLHPG
jgi:hypothetical protein